MRRVLLMLAALALLATTASAQTAEEIVAKYKEHSKGFDILRFFGGYSYTKNAKWAITAGFILQFQLNRNNTNVDVYFGPSVAMRYHFGKSKHPQPPPDPDID